MNLPQQVPGDTVLQYFPLFLCLACSRRKKQLHTTTQTHLPLADFHLSVSVCIRSRRYLLFLLHQKVLGSLLSWWQSLR